MKKALNVTNVLNTKVSRIALSDKFYEAFGNPQDFGVWFIWGASGCGKSSFLMQLAKELARTYTLLHNTLEEDLDDAEYIDRMKMQNMQDVEGNYYGVQQTYEEMGEYLTGNRKYKHKVIIIDSAHYFFRNFAEYRAFKAKWISEQADKSKKKIIIMTGSSDGKWPDSQMLKEIMRDAKMKIHVSAYCAYCKGRTVGPNGGEFIIYKKGYDKIHGTGASQEKSEERSENE